jgi:hypothetical protein
MRKLIAVLSIVSALGFAVALAGTNDPSSQNPSQDTSASSGNMQGSSEMSGTAESPSSDTSKMQEQTQPSETSKKPTKDKWSSAKSCTDDSGVTYQKGKTGFQACVDKMRKAEKEQMGGTTPSDSMNKKGSDTNQQQNPEKQDASNPSGGSNY